MKRALLLATLLAAGCSFPDPEFDLSDAKADSSAADVQSDTNAADEGTDTSAEDVSTDAPDTSSEGGSCPSGNNCDCDGDGDQLLKTGCSAGGKDCDDGDPRRNSKVTSFQDYSLDGVTHGGDWDCSGTPTREYPDKVNCGGLSLTGCSGQGYRETAPTCGSTATFVRCKSNGLTCGEDSAATTSIKVRCK